MAGDTTERVRRLWTPKEDEKLRLLVSYWGDQCGKNGHWDKISLHFENRSSKDCRKRWFHSLDPQLRRGRWTAAEDKILVEAYEKLGPAWQRIAQQIPGRTDDQCAKRYNDVLNPKFSGRLRDWTAEEDLKLLDLVEMHGTRWRDICKEMEGRTGLVCRNRWRKLMREQNKNQEEDPESDTQTPTAEGATNSPSASSLDNNVPRPGNDQLVEANQPNITSPTVYSHPPAMTESHDINRNASRLPYNAPSRSSRLGPNVRPDVQKSYTITLENPNYYSSPSVQSNDDQQHYALSEYDLDKVLAFAAKNGQKIVIHQHIYGDAGGMATTAATTSMTSLPPSQIGHIPATPQSNRNFYGPQSPVDTRAQAFIPEAAGPMNIQQPVQPITTIPSGLSTSIAPSPRMEETPQPPDELIFGAGGFYDPDQRSFGMSELPQFDFLAFNPS